MFKEGYYMATGRILGKLPFPENAEIARRAASEGITLLKNNAVLPLTDRKAALFGVGALDTVICGTGSGYAFSPYKVTVAQGLKNAGFELTSALWEKNYAARRKAAEKNAKLSLLQKRWSGLSVMVPEATLTEAELRDAAGTDTAIYVICRNAGEGGDRKNAPGDYMLTNTEKRNLEALGKAFRKLIVVLNTCIIDAAELDRIPGIGAILMLGQAGLEAGNALADVLTGKVNPSGKLTATWALSYRDYPASATFSANDGNVDSEDYTEDIYVGYRYFDTFGKEVKYPFGYGLSYTTFAVECVGVTANCDSVNVDVKVTNTGKAAGKEVVQLYVTAPEGVLAKPCQELKAYRKTPLLAAGEAAQITLSFPTASMASYSEQDAAWILEKGIYLLRLGCSSRSTQIVAALTLDETTVTEQLENRLSLQKELDLLTAPARAKEFLPEGLPVIALSKASFPAPAKAVYSPREVTAYVPEGSTLILPERTDRAAFPLKETVTCVRAVPDATLQDVAAGTVTPEEFVASLDIETLLRIVTGTGKETPHPVAVRKPGMKKNTIAMAASGKTTVQYAESLGIPATAMCDGPSGLHLMGSACTAFPVGMVLAQTWDPELAREIGDAYGKELELYKVNVGLGPGMNIYRDPLCGRNFEYFSEDPLVTGLTAAAYTRGMQEKHPSCGVALKHFACNNQEENRINESSNVSERALREIYLKGFELCVKTADPLTIMTSYNCINGIHASSRYDLLTDVVRGEWGFKGLIMTDWDSRSTKPYDFHAGNDIIMGGYDTTRLMSAYTGKAPEFGEDGAVVSREVKAYGGFFKNLVEEWNSFEPAKDGPDTVKTTVKAGTALSDRVTKAAEAGIAEVHDLPDGSREVIWHGVSKGSWLLLGDVQKCAINVLRYILRVSGM